MADSTELKLARAQLLGTRIYVVPYCHADWAWTHTRRWHELRYAQAIAEVLDIIAAQERDGVAADAPEAFRWYLDCFRMELVPFLEACPHRIPELRQRLAEGRVAICGGYANVRVNHVEGETFLRSMIYGRREFARLFPEADLRVQSDLVDIAVGYPQLPQLLRLAGYQYLQFWRPHEALNHKGVPYHFVWRGLDGTEVLCSRGCYGGLADGRYVPPDFAANWDELSAFWWQNGLSDKRQRSPAGVLWLQHGADDSRPLRTMFFRDEPLDLPALIRTWNQREGSRLAFATPVEVFEELDRRRADLPAWQGTLDACDVSYNTAWFGSHGLWRLRQLCAQAVGQAEQWGLLAQVLAGGGPGQARASRDTPGAAGPWQACCEALWRDTLLFSAHAMQWLFQDDFDEVYALAQNTLFAARRLQTEARRRIAAHLSLPANTAALVFNPLPHERTVTVPLRLTFGEGDKRGVPTPLRLLDANRTELVYQVSGDMSHCGICWELDALVQLRLPPGGVSAVLWEAAAPASAPQPKIQADADTLANDRLRLRFHRGRLVDITETDTGRTWTAPAAVAFGQLRAYAVDTAPNLHVGPITAQVDAVWETWRVTESGPVRWCFRSEGHVGQHRLSQEVRLYQGERRVEFGLTVDWSRFEGFLAAHVPFPGDGRLVGDMPFCFEDKDPGREPRVGIERCRDGMFIAQSLVDWTDGSRSLAYISHDGDRYYIYDQRASTLAHILINSVWRQPGTWEQHVNRQMEGVGRHEFSFSLVPHAGDWREAYLWRLADELRTPASTAWPLGGGTGLQPGEAWLALAPENVRLSALYREGERLLCRIYETAGREVEAEVRLPLPAAGAQAVDLLGQPRPEPAVGVAGNVARLRLRPWQMVTLAVTLPASVLGRVSEGCVSGAQG